MSVYAMTVEMFAESIRSVYTVGLTDKLNIITTCSKASYRRSLNNHEKGASFRNKGVFVQSRFYIQRDR